MTNITEEKKVLRKTFLQERENLSAGEVAAKSALIADLLWALPQVRQAKTVMAYMPFRQEVDITLLFSRLWQNGAQIAVPVCHPDRCGLMQAALLRPDTAWQSNRYGIDEPAEKIVLSKKEIDLLFIPGVAFAKNHARLGYGGGYYDRFLADMPATAYKIGVAFSLQVKDVLPFGAGDLNVDMVMTEQGSF